MKDTLGEVQSKIKELKSDEVLILVLMEDTLGVLSPAESSKLDTKVLILVLMEDTLGGVDTYLWASTLLS